MPHPKQKLKPRRVISARVWKVDIRCADSRYPLKVRNLITTLKSILNELESAHIPDSVEELSVVFVSNSRIKELNKRFRAKNKVTDVLSFSQIEGQMPGADLKSLGDIVIALECAKLQAPDFGNDFTEEILRLLIHGILHLFGYEHENVSAKQAKRMQELEDKLFLKYRKQACRFLA